MAEGSLKARLCGIPQLDDKGVSVRSVKFCDLHEALNLAIFMKHLQIFYNHFIFEFRLYLLHFEFGLLQILNIVMELKLRSITWIKNGLGAFH